MSTTDAQGRISIDPRVWGSSAWVYLDAVVATFPSKMTSTADEEERINRLFLFWANLQLPCSECQAHYLRYWGEHPLEECLHDRAKYCEWYTRLKSVMPRSTGGAVGANAITPSGRTAIPFLTRGTRGPATTAGPDRPGSTCPCAAAGSALPHTSSQKAGSAIARTRLVRRSV